MFLVWTLVSILSVHAQAHADFLAATGTLDHSNLVPLTEVCSWVGENLYRGADPDGRWEDYKKSPDHQANVEYPWTHHGVGIAQMTDGRWVVVDVFCEASIAPTTTTPPPPRPQITSSSPPTITTVTTAPVFVPLGSAPPFCDDHLERLAICVE